MALALPAEPAALALFVLRRWTAMGRRLETNSEPQLSPPVDLAQGADTDATDNDACNKVGLG